MEWCEITFSSMISNYFCRDRLLPESKIISHTKNTKIDWNTNGIFRAIANCPEWIECSAVTYDVQITYDSINFVRLIKVDVVACGRARCRFVLIHWIQTLDSHRMNVSAAKAEANSINVIMICFVSIRVDATDYRLPLSRYEYEIYKYPIHRIRASHYSLVSRKCFELKTFSSLRLPARVRSTAVTTTHSVSHTSPTTKTLQYSGIRQPKTQFEKSKSKEKKKKQNTKLDSLTLGLIFACFCCCHCRGCCSCVRTYSWRSFAFNLLRRWMRERRKEWERLFVISVFVWPCKCDRIAHRINRICDSPRATYQCTIR